MRTREIMEIIYYVHGSTLDNESKISSGWEQVSLSLKGVKETQEASLQIDSSKFDAIFASDLSRAVESAEILFAERKHEIKMDSRLRECNYGTYTKKPSNELIYSDHINIPFPNGESLHDVEKRMSEFLRETKALGYKHITIVAHRAPQLALDVITAKTSWEEAIADDWRATGYWQSGWEYIFI